MTRKSNDEVIAPRARRSTRRIAAPAALLALCFLVPPGCNPGSEEASNVAAESQNPAHSQTQPAQQDVRGPIVVDMKTGKLNYDLGPVEQGTRHRMRFELRNDRPVPLKITKLRNSCACTATTSPEEVPANGSAEILADFTTPRIVLGRYDTQLAVFTDNPDLPVIFIVFTADIRRAKQ